MHGTVLRRALSLRDLVVYGLLFIGPLAPVGVFGVLDARTGGAVALVYLLATIAMAFTAWSYAEMSRVVPHAGAVFAYATAGLGRAAGFVAGWMAMLDYLLIPAVAYLFSGIALHALVPAVPAWTFTVAAFAATSALNVAGVAVAARVGFVVLVAELVVLALFLAAAAVVLAVEGPTRPWTSPVAGLSGLDGAAVVTGLSVAVLSFLGFDAIASFAEENAGESRQVGRAVLLCLGGAGLLFVAQTWVASLISPIAPADLATDPSRQGTAFYDLARLAIGPSMAALLALTKAIGPAFAAMTAHAAAARLLFGMARERRLPALLARVNARGAPAAALASTGALTLGVAVWAARRADGLELLVSIVDVGALSAFTLLHASVIGYFAVRRRAERSIAHVWVPLLGGLVTIAVVAGAATTALVVGVAWLAVGAAIAVSRRARAPAAAPSPRAD
ncbi:MAG: APC family permease [Acidobacteriota bacterium]